MGNPEPTFLARAVRVRERRIVGETHLKLFLEQEGRCLPAIGFGMADPRWRPAISSTSSSAPWSTSGTAMNTRSCGCGICAPPGA